MVGGKRTGLPFQALGEAVHWSLVFLRTTPEARHTDLEDMHRHMEPWGSSNYRGNYIQGSAAEFAGTMDSTAAAESLLNPLLLAGIGPPRLGSFGLVRR